MTTNGPGAAARADRSADLAVGGAQMGLGYLVTAFGPYLAGLAADLDRPHRELVWVTSTFGIGLVLVALLGPLVLRCGAGRVLRSAALAAAAGAALMAVTSALPFVALGSALVGLGCAGMVLLTPYLLTGAGAAKRMTRALGAAAAAALCAPLAFGALEATGAPGRLALLVPVPVLVAIAVRRSVVAPESQAAAARARIPFGPVTRGGLRIWLAVACEYAFVVWGVARLAETGIALGTASALGAAYAVGLTVGRIGGQWIASRPWAFRAAAGATALGTAVTFAGSGPAVVTCGIALASMGVALMFPLALADLFAVPGLEARHAAAVGSFAQGAAVLAAPAALGLLGTVVDLRVALLLPLPLVALLLLLPRTAPAPTAAPADPRAELASSDPVPRKVSNDTRTLRVRVLGSEHDPHHRCATTT